MDLSCTEALFSPAGVLAMIDDGELDWKVIAISEDDPKAASVNDIEDVERWAPVHLKCSTTAWLRAQGSGSGALGNEHPCRV